MSSTGFRKLYKFTLQNIRHQPKNSTQLLFGNKRCCFASLSNIKQIKNLESKSLLFEQKGSFSIDTTHKSNNQVESSSNSNDQNEKARLDFVNGLVKLTVLLPGRREKCEFSLKLINDTCADLIESIKTEDKSVEKVVLYTDNDIRIAQNTSIGSLVQQEFKIQINDSVYKLQPPSALVKRADNDLLDAASKQDLDEIRKLVSKLYLHLNVEQFDAEREYEITRKLELVKNELIPMEKIRDELELKAKKHTNRMIWLGLGMMCVQMGIMARLTWFDYSWDIVEPISYFVSYAAVIGVYAYFVLTRKEYDYESASDRIFLRHFHKSAMRNRLDVSKYNELKNTMFLLENELKKLKESRK